MDPLSSELDAVLDALEPLLPLEPLDLVVEAELPPLVALHVGSDRCLCHTTVCTHEEPPEVAAAEPVWPDAVASPFTQSSLLPLAMVTASVYAMLPVLSLMDRVLRAALARTLRGADRSAHMEVPEAISTFQVMDVASVWSNDLRAPLV